MRCSTSTRLFLALALLGVSACSSDKNNNSGTKPRTDTGVLPVTDTGVNDPGDGGIGDTGMCNPAANPMGCVPNQQISGLDCRCLAGCATGYIYNAGPPVTCVLDTTDGGPRPDTGVVDTGTPFDGGPGFDGGFPDTGIPPPTACTTNAQCMTGEECIEGMNGDLCTTQPDCFCIQACVPNQATNTCPTGEACLWLRPGTRGVCIQEAPGAGTQNQACTAQFDPGGNLTGDSCAVNFYCWGAGPAAPTGVCARLCPPGGAAVCPTLGNYQCEDLGTTPGQIGLCLDPHPTFTDLGAACTSGPNCMSNFCSQTLGGACAFECGGLVTCPTGFECLTTQQEGAICIGTCTFGAAGDTLCQGRNVDSVCETVGTAPNTIDICIPKCTMNMDCGPAPATCNVATGHCN